MLFLPIHTNPFLMAALLTGTGLVASFLAADLIRRIPGMRAIF